MDHYEIFNTIGYIFCLICSDEFTATITSISEKCDIPVPVARKYIYQLYKNKLIAIHIRILNDDDNDLWESADTEALFEDISHGIYDNSEITIEDIESINAGFFLIPFTSIEYECMKNYYPRMIDDTGLNTFEVKDVFGSVSKDILSIAAALQSAISCHKKISIEYISSGEKALSCVCTPVEIIHNTTHHLLYLRDTENNLYRLDRIRCSLNADGRIVNGIQEVSGASASKPHVSSPLSKYYWGTDSREVSPRHGRREKPVHVKLQLKNVTRNLLNKIKKDTVLRTETAKLYEENGSWYYEDDILGIQDFRRWLRGYGSSLVVLEPASLIDEIIQGYHTTLEYYNILDKVSLR